MTLGGRSKNGRCKLSTLINSVCKLSTGSVTLSGRRSFLVKKVRGQSDHQTRGHPLVLQSPTGRATGQVFNSGFCVTCMQGHGICKDCSKICNCGSRWLLFDFCWLLVDLRWLLCGLSWLQVGPRAVARKPEIFVITF